LTNTTLTADDSNDRAELLASGWGKLRAGDHRGALAVADSLVDADAPSAPDLLFAGEAHFAMGNFRGTDNIATRAIERFPDDINARVLKCRALMAMGRLGPARDQALELAGMGITDENHIEVLVTILGGLMEPAAAYPLCRQSVERDPGNPRAQRRLALTCRMIGRFDEARQAADIAIAANPHDYEMIGLRSAVSTATPENNHVKAMEDLLEAGCRSALGAARVSYALAKENEELGNYSRSFQYLDAGSKFKRHTLKYDLNRDLEILGLIQKTFSRDRLKSAAEGFRTREPIFILGLPRTGSTLLERILSSHRDVYAAGELLHLNTAMTAELKRIGAPADPAGQLSKVFNCDPARIGKDYLERTRPFTGHTKHFIDKRPLNFLLIGLISQALPDAQIIHVRRTPLDACFAIYKFMFNDAYPWSYDLDDIARYYIAYRRMMEHWHDAVPGRIIDIAYEDVTADAETETRTLLERMGLPWDPACLEFHKNEAAAMTGSAAQVRKKIYSSSVGRWKDYEEELKYIAFALETAGFDPYKP
jgi:tetratricopeptide (TPR) repeat protein